MKKILRNKVYKFVKAAAKTYGYKIVVDDTEPNMFGAIYPDQKLMRLSTHVRYGGEGSKLEEVKIREMEDTALHELAHIFQYERMDQRITANIAGLPAYVWTNIIDDGGGATKDVRKRTLRYVYELEMEAETFSLEMREKLGVLKNKRKEVRKSARTLMTYVMLLHFERRMTPIEIKKLFNQTDMRLTRVIPSLQDMIESIRKVVK